MEFRTVLSPSTSGTVYSRKRKSDSLEQESNVELISVTPLVPANYQGKVIHLVSKHKDLCAAHNEQCIYQRNSVISPLAPAALRIAQCTEDEEEEEYTPYEDVAFEDFSESPYNRLDLAYDEVHYE
ncbi:hypothetical protein OESDEN_08539 [Oesophagostomum dentatum]|uniref:Uncharacterized protein n=1 Tax=Oesophagostomum dentatum TaxID=61180 RepID=A0A0B1T233_OESDE|nr:hypothetical protein OESDEN_08539 [Oesophagostomum dentatum]